MKIILVANFVLYAILFCSCSNQYCLNLDYQGIDNNVSIYIYERLEYCYYKIKFNNIYGHLKVDTGRLKVVGDDLAQIYFGNDSEDPLDFKLTELDNEYHDTFTIPDKGIFKQELFISKVADTDKFKIRLLNSHGILQDGELIYFDVILFFDLKKGFVGSYLTYENCNCYINPKGNIYKGYIDYSRLELRQIR